MGTSLKGKNLLPEGANSFPLREVPYGMENQFYHIRSPPLNVTIFITHMRSCVMGASPMMTVSIKDHEPDMHDIQHASPRNKSQVGSIDCISLLPTIIVF